MINKKYRQADRLALKFSYVYFLIIYQVIQLDNLLSAVSDIVICKYTRTERSKDASLAIQGAKTETTSMTQSRTTQTKSGALRTKQSSKFKV